MSTKFETFPVSPMPLVDPTVDTSGILLLTKSLIISDYIAVSKSRDDYYKEQLVRLEEIKIIRDKLKWCFRREGVNHFQNCRHLSLQYLDLIKTMKKGGIIAYKKPTSQQQVPDI